MPDFLPYLFIITSIQGYFTRQFAPVMSPPHICQTNASYTSRKHPIQILHSINPNKCRYFLSTQIHNKRLIQSIRPRQESKTFGIIIHTNRNTQSLLSFTVSIKKVVHSYFLIFSRYHRYTRKVPIFFRNNQTLDLISKYIRKNFLPNSVTFKIIDTQHNCILLPA